METKSRGDLVINGLGASNGGQFNLVKINGKGTINSGIECREFECNGSGVVNGDIVADKTKVSGNAKINGNVKSRMLMISGTAKVDQNLQVEHLHVSGKASVRGRVKSEEIKIKGKLTIDEDCEAEIFKAESQFKIGGLLNAEQIDIKMFGECRANEIGGQSIRIKANGSFISHLFKSIFRPQLETDLIEGDKVEIENTNAKIVRGNHVTIGPNSTIGLVEYTADIVIDKKAIVGESRKV